MSDTAPTPTPDPTPVAPVASAPVQVPAGYVPQTDLDRVEGQRRGFQSEVERLKAELARVQTAPTATPAKEDKGFDPDAFRRQLLSEVLGATALQTEAEKIKAEFPHANPSMFSAESLASFGSPEALRVAAESDHQRIAAAVQAAADAREAEIKAQLGQVGNPGGPVAPPTPGVDPTVQQLAAMSPSELDAYDAANPGVISRVMAAAQAG